MASRLIVVDSDSERGLPIQLISSSIFVSDTRGKRATCFTSTMPQYLQQLQYGFKRATKLPLRSSVPFLINVFGNTAIQLYGHSISIDSWLEVVFTAGLPIQCPGRLQSS